MPSTGPIIDIAVITGESHKQGRIEGEKGRGDGVGGAASLVLPFAQRGQSSQEKHQAHGPWWDDEGSITCPNAGGDGEASCRSEFLLLGY